MLLLPDVTWLGLCSYRLSSSGISGRLYECDRDIDDDDILYAKETDKVFSFWANRS